MICNEIVEMNRTPAPKSVLRYFLDKGHVLRSGILLVYKLLSYGNWKCIKLNLPLDPVYVVGAGIQWKVSHVRENCVTGRVVTEHGPLESRTKWQPSCLWTIGKQNFKMFDIPMYSVFQCWFFKPHCNDYHIFYRFPKNWLRKKKTWTIETCWLSSWRQPP